MMAAVNSGTSVTDKLVASGGADERGETVANSKMAASKVLVEGNVEENLQVAANGGEETFSTPCRNGGEQVLKDEVAVVSTGQRSSTGATAPVWRLGQRVKVLEKCDGLVLFKGTDLQQESWYGVALDEELGNNDGYAGDIKRFDCRAKHGVFVKSASLQAAEMSASDKLLEAILGGKVVSESELNELTIRQICVYLKHNDVSLKSGWKKIDHVARALVVMGAVMPAAAPVLTAVMPVQKADEMSDEKLIVQIDAAAIGVVGDQVMGVHHEAGIVGGDLETQINTALGLDGEQSVDMRRVGANVGPEVENLNQPMDVFRQTEPVSSTPCSPKQNNHRRMLPVVPAIRSPTSPSTTAPPTAPPPTAHLTPLDAGDSASSPSTPHSAQDGVAAVVNCDHVHAIKPVPEVFTEGTYLEWFVAHVREEIEGSLNTIVNAVARSGTKKFQMKGPMDKLRLVLGKMESVYASIASSDSGDAEESAAASEITAPSVSVGSAFRQLWLFPAAHVVSGQPPAPVMVRNQQCVPAGTTVKSITSAKFQLDLPPVTTKLGSWSDAIPEVTATLTRFAAGGDQQLKDKKKGSVVEPPPTVSSATFSSTFGPGNNARFVSWDHDAIGAAASRAQGSVGALSKVEHSTTLPAAVQGQEGTIGVTNQDQGAVKMTGEIIKIFHWDRYGFIRSERSGDFFIGSAELYPMMKVGDRVEFLHYPRIHLQGRCPMAFDIAKQLGGRTSGAPAALSSTTAFPALDSTNPWNIKAKGHNGVAPVPKGVKAGVATGAAKSGAKDAWDVRLDSMQSLLERLDKRMDTERADMRQMLETFRRQEVPVGAF